MSEKKEISAQEAFDVLYDFMDDARECHRDRNRAETFYKALNDIEEIIQKAKADMRLG